MIEYIRVLCAICENTVSKLNTISTYIKDPGGVFIMDLVVGVDMLVVGVVDWKCSK